MNEDFLRALRLLSAYALAGDAPRRTLEQVITAYEHGLQMKNEDRARAATVYSELLDAGFLLSEEIKAYAAKYRSRRFVLLNTLDALFRLESLSTQDVFVSQHGTLLMIAEAFGFSEEEFSRLSSVYFGGLAIRELDDKAPLAEEIAPEARLALAVLGCDQDSSFEEIKRSYRELMMLYHPDRDRAVEVPTKLRPAIHERFLQIQDAFEVISRRYSES